MTIDPTTLPDGTVVEIDAGFHGAFYVDKDGYQTDREDINDGMPSFTSRDSRLSRVFVPVPEGMAYADAVAALADAGAWVEVDDPNAAPRPARHLSRLPQEGALVSIQPEAIHDDYDTPDVCLRCQVDPSMPASCPPCLGEVNAARERDNGAAATLAWIRAGFDANGFTTPRMWAP